VAILVELENSKIKYKSRRAGASRSQAKHRFDLKNALISSRHDPATRDAFI
jgi:hypothetical protein